MVYSNFGVMDINERIRKFIKSKKITIQSFEASIGRTNGYLSHTKSPTATVLAKIKEVYPDINLNWLITGKDEPVVQEEGEYYKNRCLELLDKIDRYRDRIEELEKEIASLKKSADRRSSGGKDAGTARKGRAG